MISDAENLFMYMLAIWMFPLKKDVYSDFLPIFQLNFFQNEL